MRSPAIMRVMHGLAHHHVGSPSLLQWLCMLLLASAVLLALNATALPNWSAALPVAGLALLAYGWWIAHTHDYVTFRPEHGTPPAPVPLPPGQAIQVAVTGLFAVEERCRRHVWLSGEYRTFPNREHAVITRLEPTRYCGIGRSREQLEGMWYIFCQPGDIADIAVGELCFGSFRKPCVRLTHRQERPGRLRRRRVRRIMGTTYLACDSEQDRWRLAADLDTQSTAIEPNHP